jgi:uncharacterized membrane protein
VSIVGTAVTGSEHSSGLLPAGTYTDIAEEVARLIELVGLGILVVGGIITAYGALRNLLAGRDAYEPARHSFGRALILALEVLVAADIVQTVAVDLTLESVSTLGLLVLIRTVLSFSLAAELEGVVPWRRADIEVKKAALSAATPPPSTAGRDGT